MCRLKRMPIVSEDSLASSLQFRLNELLGDSEPPDSSPEPPDSSPAGSQFRVARLSATDTEPRVTMPRHLKRYLPLSIFATLAVILGPVAVVSLLVPNHGILWQALAVVLAVLGSLAIASVGSRLWQRWARSREMIFAELMLWGWVRRFWIERRLGHTRDLFESARRYGPTVSIELLTRLSDLHQALDPYVHGHSRRVASYAVRIAHEMRLSAAEIAKIETAALVHDIGKVYTPAEILHKPDRLTDREFAIIKLHAPDGADIVAEAGDPEITSMVRHHHERLDGKGYPDGIAEAEIPLGARIIAVADTFDAITSVRSYRPSRTHREAIEILSKEAGEQLDAEAVAAFVACYAGRRLVRRSAFASAVPERILTMLKASPANLAGGSIAQTIPALGAAGVLAVSPAFHQRGEVRQERGAPVARLASSPTSPPTAEAPESKRARPLSHRLLHARETPGANVPSHAITGDPSKNPTTTGTATPGPSVQPPVGEAKPTPSRPETSKPEPVTPRPPAGGPSPTPTVPLPTPAEAPVTVPPVTVSAPPPVGVQTPSVSTPTVKLPAVEVPTVTVPSINLRVSG
jgi:putative nucleotidyltransferase with HDIG domain